MLRKLLEEAQRLNVTVIYGELPHPYRALYRPSKELIIIHRGLTEPQQIEALAHELGHALRSHDCTDDHTEAQAWRRAAQLTVNVEEYARAERINPHPSAIALELGLTTRLITEWQRHFGHQYERMAA